MVVGRETFQLAFRARKGGGGANTLCQRFDSEQRWALLGIAQFVLVDKLKIMKHRHVPYMTFLMFRAIPGKRERKCSCVELSDGGLGVGKDWPCCYRHRFDKNPTKILVKIN
jgi:hypothetical protein